MFCDDIMKEFLAWSSLPQEPKTSDNKNSDRWVEIPLWRYLSSLSELEIQFSQVSAWGQVVAGGKTTQGQGRIDVAPCTGSQHVKSLTREWVGRTLKITCFETGIRFMWKEASPFVLNKPEQSICRWQACHPSGSQRVSAVFQCKGVLRSLEETNANTPPTIKASRNTSRCHVEKSGLLSKLPTLNKTGQQEGAPSE